MDVQTNTASVAWKPFVAHLVAEYEGPSEGGDEWQPGPTGDLQCRSSGLQADGAGSLLQVNIVADKEVVAHPTESSRHQDWQSYWQPPPSSSRHTREDLTNCWNIKI